MLGEIEFDEHTNIEKSSGGELEIKSLFARERIVILLGEKKNNLSVHYLVMKK